MIFLRQILTAAFCCCFLACQNYLEIDAPFDQLPSSEIFEDEATAVAAVTTMYAKLRDEVLISGGQTGTGFIMALYADELDYYVSSGRHEPFYLHQIFPSNDVIAGIWNNAYNLIYMSNAVLEGLEKSENIDNANKSQLMGEAFFVRALVHFYLVNLFGEIPYITNTDYLENSKVNKIREPEVYKAIIADLTTAKTMLGETYVSAERTRPNKWVASALLARVYLYLEQWELAEAESEAIINSTSLYNLQIPIEEVFLKESPSALWQLKPEKEGDNTAEGTLFILLAGPPNIAALNPVLLQEMEKGDLRRTHWVGEISNDNATWYFPYKYKQRVNADADYEYAIVFRLAEQYLVRAEARARLGNASGAQQDINAVRKRAGLADTPASTGDALVSAILKERRFELFTEYGHRWFDLKRTGLAGQVVGPLKPGWTSTDILLPLPESELLMNPNLEPQNSGY